MNVPLSSKSNQQAYDDADHELSDKSFHQRGHQYGGGGQYNANARAVGGISKGGSAYCRVGSGIVGGGDWKDSPRKGSVLWAVARKMLLPAHRNQQLASVNTDPIYWQQDSIELKNTRTTTPRAIIDIDTSHVGHDRRVRKLAEYDSRKGSSSMMSYDDQSATIQQLQSNLERERKLLHEYHEDWEESQMETLKLKEYARTLQAEIVRLNQQHALQNFGHIPQSLPELPFLCPVDLHLHEDYPRVGRYERESLLGRGQFGIVWEATLHRPIRSIVGSLDTDFGAETNFQKRHIKERVFAIKEIDKERLNSYRKLAALNREVLALQVFQHPNIIHLVGVLHGPKSFYMVFEKAWMDAHTLNRASSLHMGTIRHIMKAVFRALRHIHANGVAHLDVKPENILIIHPDHVGGVDDHDAADMLRSEDVRLCDFGLCIIDKNRQQQEEQRRLGQQRQISQKHQPFRQNNLYCHDIMPEFNVGDCNFLRYGISTTSEDLVDDDHQALGNRMNDGPSLYEQGNTVIGTPGFYAPEMAERESFDAMAADMWSAGACLIEFSLGIPDCWWNTYEQYGINRRRRRQCQDVQSSPLDAHPRPSVPTTTFKLGEELNRYLEAMAGIKWNDNYLKDFLLNGLMVEPESRSTASQALGHPWMSSSEKMR